MNDTSSRTPTGSTAPPDRPPEPDKKGLDLSLTQIVGGALAAMTAAVLGAQLSLAGTVVGAAVASVVAAVGGSLYTASLRRTRDSVRTAWRGRVADVPTTIELVHDPADTAADAPAVPVEDTAADLTKDSPGSGKLWIRIAAAAVAIFALAAAALTTIELVSGQALSGGSGTTIEQVRQGGTASQDPKPKSGASTGAATPSRSQSSATTQSTAPASPSPSASSSVASEPSAGGQAAPSTAPSTATPTATPSESASVSPSSSATTTAGTG